MAVIDPTKMHTFCVQKLEEQAKISSRRGQDLQIFLEDFADDNGYFDCGVTEAEISEIAAKYPDEPTTEDRIHAAIDSDDPMQVINASPFIAQLMPLDLAQVRQEIRERYGKRLNLHDLNRAISYEQRKIKLAESEGKKDVADIAQEWAMMHRDTWAYDSGANTWRYWNGEYWEAQDKTYLLDKATVQALQDNEIAVSSQTAMNTFQRLAEGHCSRVFSSDRNLVNFRNGTLHLDTGEITGFQREDSLTYQLDYSYDHTMPHPKITAFLESIYLKRDENGNYSTDYHMVQAFEAHLGLALMRNVSMHKAIAQIGAKRAGKSLSMKLANAVCGVAIEGENASLIRYGSFAGDDLFSNELEGKRARYTRRNQRIVCCDEISADVFVKNENLMKDMPAHSGVPMRGMHKDDEQNNTWTPKLLISANDLPKYLDYSGAINDRFIILDTPRHLTDGERDLELLEKLLEELPGFAHTCLRMAQLALQRGYYPKSAYMKGIISALATGSNVLRSFLEERLVLDSNAVCRSETIFEPFREYRIARGHTGPYAQHTMVSELINMRVGIHNNNNRASRKLTGKPLKGLLFGVRLREDDEDLPPDDDVKDDVLLDAPIVEAACNLDVTSCNLDVTSGGYKNDGTQNGSTGSINASDQVPCNLVTSNLENFSYEEKSVDNDTHTTLSIREDINSEKRGYKGYNRSRSATTEHFTGYTEVTTKVTNARQFYRNFITRPNHFLRLREDGQIAIGVPAEISDEDFDKVAAIVERHNAELTAILKNEALAS